MELKLDYQIKPHRPRPLLLALLLMGVAAAAIVTREYGALQQRIDERSAALQQLQLARGVKPQPSPKEQRLSTAMQKAEYEILIRLSLPWVALFKALENAQERSVALLAIEPNVKTGTVRLTAESGTLEQALSYIGRLQREQALSEVTLVEHEIAPETGGGPVRFTLNLAWSSAR